MGLGMANEKIIWQNDYLEKYRSCFTNEVYDLSSYGLLIKFTEPGISSFLWNRPQNKS